MRRDGAMFALALGTATGMCLQYLSVPIPPLPPAHSPCHFVTSPSPSPEGGISVAANVTEIDAGHKTPEAARLPGFFMPLIA